MSEAPALVRYVVRARKLVDFSIVLLALGAGLTLLEQVAGAVGSGLFAVGAAAVTWFCNRMATSSVKANMVFHLWRLLPALLFVVVPFIAHFWSREETSTFETILEFAKPMLVFVIPLLLLTVADLQLRKCLPAAPAADLTGPTS